MRVRAYNKELKENIIKLYMEEHRTITSLSEEYGISQSTISRWLAIYRNTELRKGKSIERN